MFGMADFLSSWYPLATGVTATTFEPLYYLAAIGATVVSGWVGIRAWMNRQQAKWVAEGRKEADLADKLETNTKTAAANTQAIGDNTAALHALGLELREFVTDAKHRFDVLDGRVGDLDRRMGGVEQAIWPRSTLPAAGGPHP